MVYKEVDGKLAPVHEGLPHSQSEEFEMAKAEDRQPRCVHCGENLDTVYEVQTVDLVWTWNPETKKYDKSDDGGDTFKPYCSNCETHDYEFTSNDFIDY